MYICNGECRKDFCMWENRGGNQRESNCQTQKNKKITARVGREKNCGGFARELAEAVEILLRYL
jgi:hypothetical protein